MQTEKDRQVLAERDPWVRGTGGATGH